MKGITQTRECCEQINFDSVRGLVEGYLDGMKEAVLETPQQGIRRDKKKISAEKPLHFRKSSGWSTIRDVSDRKSTRLNSSHSH